MFSSEKSKDWRPNTYIRSGESIKVSIFDLGKLEVNVEYIAEYDLVTHMQKDLQEQRF